MNHRLRSGILHFYVQSTLAGTTIIRMADLKNMFASFGLEHVGTHIQTGSVIFEAQEGSASLLEKQIERLLDETYVKSIRRFVRTRCEVVKMVKQ